MENLEIENKTYEISFLVKTEEEISGVVDFLKNHKAEIISEPVAKNITLAYEIKKNKEAVFVYLKFKATGEDVKLIEKDLNLANLVIRFLIIILPKEVYVKPRSENQVEEKKAKPAPVQHIQIKQSNASLSNEALEKKIEEILK
jgi:ribosomal protein S6